MGKLTVECFVVSAAASNCYFAIHEETKETLIIDPGASGEQLAARARKEALVPVAVLLTHGHFDHAGAADVVSQAFSIPVYALDLERETLLSPQINGSWMIDKEEIYHADRFLSDEQEITLAGFLIRVLHTPGHTPGSCSFYFPEEGVVFTGDALFHESVGRTDFVKGSMSDLIRGIREKLFVLPDETICYPGHEDSTTIGHEKKYNPFL